MHAFLESLVNRFPQAVLTAQQDPVRLDLWAQVQADHWLEIAQFLHDDPSMALDHITDICSADYPDDLERFEVIYHFLSLPHGTRLRIKARVTEDQPEIASISAIWKGANFLEREVYDLMGIRFSGHPDLRRILMPDDYDEGYPLRKDFPAEGKGWRSRFDFLPRLDEPVGEWSESEVPDDQRHQFMADDRPGDTKRTTEMLLNMGPQHPSTHGVLRVVLELDGERVSKATPDLGYLHRGVEKLAEGLTYMQMVPHTDRLDYVCAMTNNYAYVRAVEKLIDMTVPERAEYVRTIVAEMQRIIGHLFWLGTQALDIGAMTVFFWTFREREVLLDMFEKLCGARLTLNYFRIGGVDGDLTPEIITTLRDFLKTFPEHIREYDTLLQKNRIW
ncbi:MAG: NADH-quinone oxidoreductase subunit C, partial [Nitrospirales bacterium]